MIGTVNPKGTPTINWHIDGQDWQTVIDTGFDGDLELPDKLFSSRVVEHLGPTLNQLAGGVIVVEELYQVQVEFDGRAILAEATFVLGDEILLGTGLLDEYRLIVDFSAKTVAIERT